MGTTGSEGGQAHWQQQQDDVDDEGEGEGEGEGEDPPPSYSDLEREDSERERIQQVRRRCQSLGTNVDEARPRGQEGVRTYVKPKSLQSVQLMLVAGTITI